VWLAPWARWDTFRYIHIAARGYRIDDGTAQFHPLFPWLATPLARLTGQPLLSLLFISSLAGLVMLLAFERLARIDVEPKDSFASTLLLLFSPFAFVLFVPYTEALFLLCAVLTFYSARRRSWWLAGLGGALATLTRQQGIFLLLPLAWELWEANQRRWHRFLAAWRDVLALGLIPISLLAWLIYRDVALADLSINLDNFQSLIYSLLISPSASKVVTIQTFMWPWKALWLALSHLWQTPDVDLAVNMVLAVFFVGLLVAAWRNMRLSYRIYALTIILVSFSYHTGPVHPYMGLPRHLFLAFPVFTGLGLAFRRPWQRLAMLVSGGAGMFLLLALYVLRAWVP
jgi:hypothetical protein